jgi:hypothetical protein
VEVHVRPDTSQDVPYYSGMEPGHNDVVITGTITECGLELAEVARAPTSVSRAP